MAEFSPAHSYSVPDATHIQTAGRFGDQVEYDAPSGSVQPNSEQEEDALEALVASGLATRDDSAPAPKKRRSTTPDPED